MEVDDNFLMEQDSFGSEPEDLEEIFSNLDRSGSGFIEKSDFENLCQNLELDGDEVEAVFKELDKDGDRRISLHEFTDGLKHVELFVRRRAVSSPACTGRVVRTSSPVTREAWGHFSHRSGRDLFLLPSQENVCELYQQLHGSATHLLPQFETVVLSIIKDYRNHQTEIDRLEKSLKRANETHEQHLQQMEEEMDQQISRAEEKCRQQEKERLEFELEQERRRWETEKAELQASVKKLQKMEANARKDKSKEDSVVSLKRKLETLMQENRKLKSNLTESNTTAAVLKSELTQLQAELEEKCEDLDRWERNSLLDYVTEQQSLSRQLEMLQSTNKKLNDTNDSLRESLGRNKRSSSRQSTRTPSPFVQRDRNGSVMSDYMMTPEPDMSPELRRSLRGSLSSLEDLTACDPGKRKCSNDIEGNMEDFLLFVGKRLGTKPAKQSETDGKTKVTTKKGANPKIEAKTADVQNRRLRKVRTPPGSVSSGGTESLSSLSSGWEEIRDGCPRGITFIGRDQRHDIGREGEVPRRQPETTPVDRHKFFDPQNEEDNLSWEGTSERGYSEATESTAGDDLSAFGWEPYPDRRQSEPAPVRRPSPFGRAGSLRLSRQQGNDLTQHTAFGVRTGENYSDDISHPAYPENNLAVNMADCENIPPAAASSNGRSYGRDPDSPALHEETFSGKLAGGTDGVEEGGTERNPLINMPPTQRLGTDPALFKSMDRTIRPRDRVAELKLLQINKLKERRLANSQLRTRYTASQARSQFNGYLRNFNTPDEGLRNLSTPESLRTFDTPVSEETSVNMARAETEGLDPTEDPGTGFQVDPRHRLDQYLHDLNMAAEKKNIIGLTQRMSLRPRQPRIAPETSAKMSWREKRQQRLLGGYVQPAKEQLKRGKDAEGTFEVVPEGMEEPLPAGPEGTASSIRDARDERRLYTAKTRPRIPDLQDRIRRYRDERQGRCGDSGHSTMKDPEESDNEFTQSTAISGLGKNSGTESEIDDSKTEAPDSQDEAMYSEGEDDSRLELRQKGRNGVTTVQRQHSTRVLPQAPRKVLTGTTAPADQKMFKVVLAGDAAVGKSSFILRLCKNEFRPNMNSTLGVDFQMKTMVIDDTPVTLQIWDTAGQERFRSIAKSYFRRADGVLLLYDCTYEPSFMNVREWVDAVEDGAPRTLPIMLCANKLDLRNDAIKSGQKVILKGHGEEMAREHGALFCETSAKQGDNVQDAVEKLMRSEALTDSLVANNGDSIPLIVNV
uniref:EF-hand domain-containing protein n=1 Tax=Branchiostoma floridae TaxID=7739 RepID=C3Z0Q8_BRAFL|eukprot:XP_002597800.1 hypothetical protein BRAFLDRAFT_100555 [Branchiostoma floridae]